MTLSVPVPLTALRLATINASNKIELNQAILARIREISRPISVLSIIGPYRSGKSFLLNLLCEGRTRFATGASTNPCTQGVWADIFEPRPESKEPCKILLDTEGLFSYNRDEAFDMMLFLFTAFASSVMLYNSLGMIDERALENFAFLAQLGQTFGKAVRERGTPNQAFEEPIKALFPDFGWVLRDFSLDLRIGEDGQRLTPDEYLEYALLSRRRSPSDRADTHQTPGKDHLPPYRRSLSSNDPGERPARIRDDFPHSHNNPNGSGLSVSPNAQKNLVRKAIKDCFPHRRCFTLVRPVHDEYLLQRIDQAKEEDIREEFMTGVDSLFQFIGATLKPKRVGDLLFTGESFAEFLTTIADAINSGFFPPIESVIVP
jgi:hypothetical protein